MTFNRIFLHVLKAERYDDRCFLIEMMMIDFHIKSAVILNNFYCIGKVFIFSHRHFTHYSRVRRSEERRVGKECRERRSQQHHNEKKWTQGETDEATRREDD